MPKIFLRFKGKKFISGEIDKLPPHFKINKNSLENLKGLIRITDEILENMLTKNNLDIEINFTSFGYIGNELLLDSRINKDIISINKERFDRSLGRRISEDLH